MKAFIPAAGYGKRMRQYTETLPKPLLPVNGIPLIDYTLFYLHKRGIQSIVINLHYMGEKIQRHLKNCRLMDIAFSNEEEILGTAGGIRKALHHFNNFFLVINPDTIYIDTICTFPVTSSRAHLYLKEAPVESRETRFSLLPDSVVKFDENGKYFFTGLSLLHPSLFENLPENKYYELGNLWKENEKYLSGEIYQGNTKDAGSLENYEILNKEKVFTDSYTSELKEFIFQCGFI